ncbi:5'-3' exonuclease [Thalassiella azotivora]
MTNADAPAPTPDPCSGRRVLLLDSASLYFRAYFGMPDSLKAPDGTPVNAVRGFLDMIAHLVTRYRPTDLVACWDDDWRPQWRVDAIPSYKAHRVVEEVAGGADVEEVPDTLSPQVPVIAELLEVLGIARVGAPGCEADDVIGTLATRAVADGADWVGVVTGDRDLFQLVDDARGVQVLYTAKGVRDLTVVDGAWLAERYGVAGGPAYADLAVLRGDPSDGLPGVPGVGEKTAAKLLRGYGDLAGVLAAVESGDRGLTATQRGRLQDAAAYLAVAPAVVNVLRDADLPDVGSGLPPVPRDGEVLDRLAALAERWGVRASVNRVLEALSACEARTG